MSAAFIRLALLRALATFRSAIQSAAHFSAVSISRISHRGGRIPHVTNMPLAFSLLAAPRAFVPGSSSTGRTSFVQCRRSYRQCATCRVVSSASPAFAADPTPNPSPSPTPAPTPSAPPPGREDEFSDANGEALDDSNAGANVATLERETEKSFDTVLQELTAIQQDGPRNVAILGTRYTSYLHQQIIELLTYANVLVGNHVFTSGAGGTNAAVIKGALRAEKPDLLTVVLPQSMHKQPSETQEQVR